MYSNDKTQGAETLAPLEQNNTTMMLTTYKPDLAINVEDYLEESVIGFDALYRSMMDCRKGVLWKDSTAAFYHRGIERCMVLSRQLHDGTYQAMPPKHFTITSPKKRDIASISFRDRVYQRSLNDNVVYPMMVRSFIYDNYACQQDKGPDKARERMKEFLHSFYRKYGTDGYVLQIDIKGYYPNMSHSVAKKVFENALPPSMFARVRTILREQYQGVKGYNPGSQLVQIAGISVLNGLDHFIKERLHIRWYIRYMDDLTLIHPSQDHLEYCYEEIIRYLSSIEFSQNEKKSRIFPVTENIPFLGFNFKLTCTGKVVMMIKPEKVKAERRKLRRQVAKSLKGLIPKENVDASYETWRSHVSKGNTYKVLKRMDCYYKSLWGCSNGENH